MGHIYAWIVYQAKNHQRDLTRRHWQERAEDLVKLADPDTWSELVRKVNDGGPRDYSKVSACRNPHCNGGRVPEGGDCNRCGLSEVDTETLLAAGRRHCTLCGKASQSTVEVDGDLLCESCAADVTALMGEEQQPEWEAVPA